MKVLMISQDMKIFDTGSVRDRIASYGTIMDELTLVVLGTGERREQKLAPNVSVIAPGGTTKPRAFFAGRRELVHLIEEKKYDVISAQDPFFLGILGASVAREHTIPLQVQLHTDCFSWGFVSESPRRIFEVMLAFIVLRGASCVRVVSDRVARSVRRITRAPVSILPILPSRNMIPSTDRTLPREGETLKLLAVSRFTKEKRIHLILEALADLPGFELTLLGDGPLRKSLETRVRKLGLERRVIFAGWQDPIPYYEKADAFIQLSRFEGYGMTLVEAAESGLPIVTTDVGIVGEVLHGGKEALVITADTRSLTDALTRLLKEPSLRTTLGEGAKRAAQAHLLSESAYLVAYGKALRVCVL